MLRSLALLLVFSVELSAQVSRVEYKTSTANSSATRFEYGLYLPPSYSSSPAKKYPVLYFLHGLYENETRWSTRGEWATIMLDRMIAEGKIGEFIVAIPFGGISFYTNTRDGSEKWEDMIVDGVHSDDRIDLPGECGQGDARHQRHFDGRIWRLKDRDEASGPVRIRQRAQRRSAPGSWPCSRNSAAGTAAAFQALFDKIYGINQDLTYWEANNPMTLAKDTKKLNGLKLYFDCGTEDDYGFDRRHPATRRDAHQSRLPA